MQAFIFLCRRSTGFLVSLVTWIGWLVVATGAEPWQVFDTQTKSSLRGLHAIDKQIAWACGSKGTILRTADGGHHWDRCVIPDLPEVEFRSIHAWDSQSACVATAGQPARILHTSDGGSTWKISYEHPSPQAFFDGLRFWDDEHGIAFSDPVDGHLLIVLSEDGGASWSPVQLDLVPNILKNEGGFAASNSSLVTQGSRHAWIGTGGETGQSARVFRTDDQGNHWAVHSVAPIPANASAGIFSVHFADEVRGVAVGGDYRKETSAENNIGISDDSGLTWRNPKISNPRGYRSCVVACSLITENADSRTVWIASGPSGCDFSLDRENWQTFSEIGFHTLTIASDHSLWAAGSQGRVAKLEPAELLLAIESLQAK